MYVKQIGFNDFFITKFRCAIKRRKWESLPRPFYETENYPHNGKRCPKHALSRVHSRAFCPHVYPYL